MLIFSSSTLACSAAEAFWYSSNRWYAANDEARENPNKNPAILVRHCQVAGKFIKSQKEDEPSAEPAYWLLLHGNSAKVRRGFTAQDSGSAQKMVLDPLTRDLTMDSSHSAQTRNGSHGGRRNMDQ